MPTDGKFLTEVIVGPETEAEDRQQRRDRYKSAIALLDENSRTYLSRTLELLREFDDRLIACLRDGRPLGELAVLFHELFEKFSNILDQRWYAIWSQRIAPAVRWQRPNDRINAEKHVHFPVFAVQGDLANQVKGDHIAAAIAAAPDVLEVISAPQEFRCGLKWLDEIKRVAREKHRGLLAMGSQEPSVGLSTAGKPGTFEFAKLRLATKGEEFRVSVEGSWTLDDQRLPLPAECIWLTYWGTVTVRDFGGDAQLWLHEHFAMVIELVRRLDQLER